MSYPRVIQPLIIEDESDAKDYYETILDGLVKEGAVAPPRFAFSHEEGRRLLEENTIYHLVILDLQLPNKASRPASTIEFGLRLRDQCINRNEYPIPVLLVISGYLDQANQRDLDVKVRDGVSYGRVLVKGDNLHDDILAAIREAQRYCDIGIHIRGSGEARYPTLSPRDEDLLRRCVLRQGQCIGLDLEWWDAEYSRPTGEFKEYKGWKKTLMGRFLLDGGLGPSRPTFFKLTPAGGAETVRREAKILQQKLRHIKVCGDLIAGDRSILVTQQVGDSNERPISLAAFLDKPADHVQPSLPGIIERVGNQVAALVGLTPDQTPLRNLLWRHHDQERLRVLWKQYNVRQARAINHNFDVDQSQCDPILVLESLSKNNRQVHFERQTCLHGDLNITNISLDDSATGPSADIFDAEGCDPGVNVRDLAMLEVTALLHQPADGEPTLVQHCETLYCDPVDVLDDLDYTQGSNRARNTFKLLAEIRKQALKRAAPSLYALMVFDCAMLQLGGLAWHSANKITHPPDAALLASLTANWLQQVAPEFFRDAA
jgi:CheY-like chemotaxis protein